MTLTERSDLVRDALKDADRKGKLDVVEAVTGIEVTELKLIMNSTGQINIVERIVLFVHLCRV